MILSQPGKWRKHPQGYFTTIQINSIPADLCAYETRDKGRKVYGLAVSGALSERDFVNVRYTPESSFQEGKLEGNDDLSRVGWLVAHREMVEEAGPDQLPPQLKQGLMGLLDCLMLS